MKDSIGFIVVVLIFLIWDAFKSYTSTSDVISTRLNRIDKKLDDLDQKQDKLILREIEPGVFNIEIAGESTAHGAVLNDEPIVGASAALEAIAESIDEHGPYFGLSDIVPYGGSSGQEFDKSDN